MAHLKLDCAHTSRPMYFHLLSSDRIAIVSNRLWSDKQKCSRRYCRNLEGPPNKQTETARAEAALQFYFKLPWFSLLKPANSQTAGGNAQEQPQLWYLLCVQSDQSGHFYESVCNCRRGCSCGVSEIFTAEASSGNTRGCACTCKAYLPGAGVLLY